MTETKEAAGSVAEAALAAMGDAAPSTPTPESAPAPTEAPSVPLHTETESLLEGAAKLDPIPTEAPSETPAPTPAPSEAPGETPAPSPAPTEAPATEPAKYEFQLPEGVTADQESMTAYTGLLAENGISSEVGQKLIDMHIATIQQYANNSLAEQHKAFAEVRKGWREQVLADEEIGGAGHQTAMSAIARMRDLFVPKEEKAAFDEFLRITGAGDHPAFLKAFHRAARFFDEPSVPAQRGSPPPQPKTPANRRAVLYDHPTSNRTGR